MHVTTEDELRGGLAIGRQSFNLGGNTLTLENVLAVVAGGTAEICNGTLRANGQVGEEVSEQCSNATEPAAGSCWPENSAARKLCGWCVKWC